MEERKGGRDGKRGGGGLGKANRKGKEQGRDGREGKREGGGRQGGRGKWKREIVEWRRKTGREGAGSDFVGLSFVRTLLAYGNGRTGECLPFAV